MKCPHCNVGIHKAFSSGALITLPDVQRKNGRVAHGSVWSWQHQRCPECLESIIYLENKLPGVGTQKHFIAYPAAASRPIPSEVIDPYRKDFAEAAAVLPYSAQASAALSRRCLQAVLKDKGGATKRDLIHQIDEAIAKGGLPAAIADQLHAVRNIGNFAAHPTKSTVTGEIMDVEPGEAEWTLDVLDALFDIYFVQPALAAKRKAELNKRLKEAGKPEIK